MPHPSDLTRLLRATLASLALAASSLTSSAQDIELAQIGPFTVLPVPDAPEVNQGIRAYLAQANQAGGVRGRQLSFFELDDRYAPEGFVEQFHKAMERRPIALLSPIGSATMTQVLKQRLLDTADVVVINAIPGAESIRTPGHPRLFHLRAGDKQQIEKIVSHTRTLGMTRLAVLYHDIPIGTSGWAVAQEAAQAQGKLQLVGVQSSAELPALAQAAQEVAKAGAQGVLLVGSPRFMADGVAALRQAGVSQSLFVLSYVPAGLLVKVAGAQGARGVGIAQTYPNPNGITLPLQRDFQAAMRAAFPQIKEYTSFQLEGYIAARTAVEAMRRIKDKDITPAALQRALHAGGEFDFGGFRLDFSKGNVGSQWVDIGVVNHEGKLRY